MDPNNGRSSKKRWKIFGAFKSATKSSSSNPRTSQNVSPGAGPVPQGKRSHLHDAIRDRNLVTVRKIVKAHPHEVHLADDQGTTPLVLAVLLGNLSIAKFLYESGACLMPQHNNDESLMYLAVLRESIPIVTWLAELRPPGMDHAAFLNARDPSGAAALHISVGKSLIDSTRILLENGADPNVLVCEAPSGVSFGTVCISNKTIPIDRAAPLTFAVAEGINIDSKKLVAMVKLLTQHGAATNIPEGASGAFPLHTAVYHDDPALIDAILDGPLDPALRAPVDVGSTPMHSEVMHGSTPLMYAATQGRFRAVKHLILRGADPTRVNNFGETGVHWAATGFKGLELGLDPEGNEHVRAAIIRMLVRGTDAGIDDAYNKDNDDDYDDDDDDNDNDDDEEKEKDGERTPAPRWKPCDVNIRTQLGSTALHAAAWMGWLRITKTLLKLGADPFVMAEGIHIETVQNARGTPAQYARLKGHFELAEVIDKWGRKLKKKREKEKKKKKGKAEEAEKGAGAS
ncbi:hypothetical protein VTJ83DRAFT_7299 [Remersonia thermophila]|uniref:Ankyrin n=1 Tax=Remersonia thermophila TaxID=72144 RepID=A0ABR4D334_9PEZI